MLRTVKLAIVAAVGFASCASAHEIRYAKGALGDPYAPYSFLIGQWNVAFTAGGKPFAKIEYLWGDNHAYILTRASVDDAPHFQGMMMWNGVHHDLDVLIATDMQAGLAQELGTASASGGAVVQNMIASYSEGVSGGGQPAGPSGATQRTRETLRQLDADHVSLSMEVETPSGWKPVMPGGDHLVMTRTSH